MRIIQSFWSRPFRKSARKHSFFFWSWALSTHLLKTHHGQVDLVTDSEGYDLLVQRLKLPFDRVSLDLDDLGTVPEGLWAFGKLKAYALQKEPFVHVDSDIFLNKPLLFTEKPPLIAFHPEINRDIYLRGFDKLNSIGFNWPHHLKRGDQGLIAANAAIIGGYDFDFIRSYAQEGMLLVLNNHEKLLQLAGELGELNIIFEQWLFHRLAENENRSVNFFFEEEFYGNHSVSALPSLVDVVHARRDYRNHCSQSRVIYLLQKYYPDTYKVVRQYLALLYPDECEMDSYYQKPDLGNDHQGFTPEILTNSLYSYQAINVSKESKAIEAGQKLIDLPWAEISRMGFRLNTESVLEFEPSNTSFYERVTSLKPMEVPEYLIDYGKGVYVLSFDEFSRNTGFQELRYDWLILELFKEIRTPEYVIQKITQSFKGFGDKLFNLVANSVLRDNRMEVDQPFNSYLQVKILEYIGLNALIRTDNLATK